MRDAPVLLMFLGLPLLGGPQGPEARYTLRDPIKVLGEEQAGLFHGPPTSMAMGEGDTLYVLDPRDKQVVVLSLRDGFLFRFGRPGAGPGEYRGPAALTYADGAVYVLDFSASRITKSTPSGEFLRTIRVPTYAMDLAVVGTYAYVACPASPDIVVRIPLDDSGGPAPVLSWDDSALAEVPRVPVFWPRLLAVGESLLVTLDHVAGYALIGGPSAAGPQVQLIRPKSPFIEESKRRFADWIAGQPPDQRDNPWRAFLGVSRWSPDHLLLDIFIGEQETYQPASIVVDTRTGRATGISLRCDRELPGPGLRVSSDRIVYADAATYTLAVYKIPQEARDPR